MELKYITKERIMELKYILAAAIIIICIAVAISSQQKTTKCEEVLDIIDTTNIYSFICKPKWSEAFRTELCGCDLYYKRGISDDNSTRYLSHVKADIIIEEKIVIWQGMMVE